MTFKSPTQPLCRYCGEKIKKDTDRVWVYDKAPTRQTRYVLGPLLTLADCQRASNIKVISVQYHEVDDEPDRPMSTEDMRPRRKKRVVSSFTTWDGESYIDEFFCNGKHAASFGYASARNGMAMPAYNDAITKRNVQSGK